MSFFRRGFSRLREALRRGGTGTLLPAYRTAFGELKEVSFSDVMTAYLRDPSCKAFVDFLGDQTGGNLTEAKDRLAQAKKFNFRKLVVVSELKWKAKVREKFRKGVDWNSQFNLKPDPIVPMSELTKMDKTLSAFSGIEEGGIAKLQKDVSDIQLIPAVPEDVKRVFQHAKDLYIYGFFRYNFFTIAQHYAYLALESAIKNRYYQSFGKEIVLTSHKGESVKVGRIDHQFIIDFCRRRRGWNVRKIKINNEKFVFYKWELLDWLVKKRIITKWERRRCERGMRLRDLMSHLTRAQILPPGYGVQELRFVADLINKIYFTQGK